MKVIVAIDKFKGSCDQTTLNKFIKAAFHSYSPEIFVQSFSVADGGEGTLLIFKELGWKAVAVNVSDPLRRPHTSYLLRSPDGNRVAIELSRICGARFLNGKKSPLDTDTFGLGQAIEAAIELQPKEIIIGLGGSASSDFGLGVFQALNLIKGGPKKSGLQGLEKNVKFDDDALTNLKNKTKYIKFTILYDTEVFLTGKRSAIKVFGKQKGLNLFQRNFYDRRVVGWIKTLERKFELPLHNLPGLGAAGGVGAAIYSIFDANLTSGSQYLLSLSGFYESAISADLIITGEGKFDKSTLTGKLALKVIERGSQLGIPVLLLSAKVEKEALWQAQSKFHHLEALELAANGGSEFLSAAEIESAITIGVHEYLGKLESLGIHL